MSPPQHWLFSLQRFYWHRCKAITYARNIPPHTSVMSARGSHFQELSRPWLIARPLSESEPSRAQPNWPTLEPGRASFPPSDGEEWLLPNHKAKSELGQSTQAGPRWAITSLSSRGSWGLAGLPLSPRVSTLHLKKCIYLKINHFINRFSMGREQSPWGRQGLMRPPSFHLTRPSKG